MINYPHTHTHINTNNKKNRYTDKQSDTNTHTHANTNIHTFKMNKDTHKSNQRSTQTKLQQKHFLTNILHPHIQKQNRNTQIQTHQTKITYTQKHT